MSEAGIDIPDAGVQHSNFGRDGGEAAARAILRDDPTITALFGVNVVMLLGALTASAAQGRSVPDTLFVVGYNDTFISQRLPTRLTSF